MSLADLIESWLNSRQTIGWKIERHKPISYIVCRDHTWPMSLGDDYIIAIFDAYIVPLASKDNTLYASDPLFLDKLWIILKNHYDTYHV